MSRGRVESKYVAHGDSYKVETKRGEAYPIIVFSPTDTAILQISKASAKHLIGILEEAVDYLEGNFGVMPNMIEYPKEPGNAS